MQSWSLVPILTLARKVTAVGYVAAALNFIILSVIGEYDVRVGPVHLAATYLFKPLLYLNAAFLLTFALNFSRRLDNPKNVSEGVFHSRLRFWAPAIAIVACVYGISFRINLDFFDWTHRSITSHATAWNFFLHRQYDGFYRPLTFLSLWIDNQIFGPALWGYHIQNLLIHLLNGFLIARLAFRLGLKQSAAEWAGLAFLAVPALFEAVIWPGARFDLMSGGFIFFALERALAGSIWVSTASFALGVLCKETAYAYPLLLVALFLLRNPLNLKLPKRKWLTTIAVGIGIAVVLVLIRVAIYGNLGGYPDVAKGGNVNFAFTPKTFASVFTRMPAALFLVNSGNGLPIWLTITLIAYVAFLSIVLFSGASAGKRTWLMVLPFIAVIPMLNMFGWMTQYAQQGRYLYQPVIWILFALVPAISAVRFSGVLMTAWVAIMSAAALFNTLAYVRMISAVHDDVVQAAAACKGAKCCRVLDIYDIPRDMYGAFYFKYQFVHDLKLALPDVEIVSDNAPRPDSACTLKLWWPHYPMYIPIRIQ